MKPDCRSPLAIALLLGTACLATNATAQTVIGSLPFTITAAGAYVLNSNLASSITSGNLITVNASNVSIDFQNHYIAGPVGNSGQTTVGVYANERSNVTIQNGTIAYCATGIAISGNGTATTNSVDAVVNNMRITYCYAFGIDVGRSPATRISNCQVSQIGYSGATSGTGINVFGTGATVQGNSVSNMIGSDSYCIYADTGSFVRQNQLSNATFGVTYGIYQDNLVDNCTFPFDGGTDAGGNFSDTPPSPNSVRIVHRPRN